MRLKSWIYSLSLLVLLACQAFAAQSRSLYWRSFDVEAVLDEEGRLQVVERHSIVFTGPWNGGERMFRLELGQKLAFHALSRLDPSTGAEKELVPGNLSRIDQYR